MKKAVISCMMMLAVCVSSVSMAAPMMSTVHKPQEATPVETKVLVRPETMKVDLYFSAFDKPGLSVRLCNVHGKVLAVKRIGKTDKQTGIRFDVSHLEDGNYHIVIRRGKFKQVHTVELKTYFPEPSFHRVVSLREEPLQ